jgi:hypothetical protein
LFGLCALLRVIDKKLLFKVDLILTEKKGLSRVFINIFSTVLKIPGTCTTKNCGEAFLLGRQALIFADTLFEV